jgi:hypothetical protein
MFQSGTLLPSKRFNYSSGLCAGTFETWSVSMKMKIVPMIVLATLALPLAAQAQGTVRGAQEGAAEGGHAAGPVGAVVGGTVGAAAGTVGGILGDQDRPRFRDYVAREHPRDYRYNGDLRVGAVLPERGVTYYDVPSEYHVKGYRYAYVNDRPVLVEPHSHRVVQVIE